MPGIDLVLAEPMQLTESIEKKPLTFSCVSKPLTGPRRDWLERWYPLLLPLSIAGNGLVTFRILSWLV